MDLRQIETLAHCVETIFSRVREKHLPIDKGTLKTIRLVLDSIEDWVVAYFGALAIWNAVVDSEAGSMAAAIAIGAALALSSPLDYQVIQRRTAKEGVAIELGQRIVELGVVDDRTCRIGIDVDATSLEAAVVRCIEHDVGREVVG